MAETERWRIAGQQRHLVVEELHGGREVHTGCGWLIWVSSTDQQRTSAPDCQTCRMVHDMRSAS